MIETLEKTSTEQPTSNVIDEMLKLTTDRKMFTSDEVLDMLLDIRTSLETTA